MKNIFLGLALTAVIAHSCTSTDTLDEFDKKEISFAVNVGKSAKSGPIEEGALPTDIYNYFLGVFAFHQPLGGTYDYSSPFMDDEPVVFSDNAWRNYTPHFWPNSGTLKFVAYAPYNYIPGADFTPTDGIILKDFNSTPDIDVLYSDITPDVSSGPVDLTLRHALTQIYFVMQTSVPDVIFHIKEFTIENVVSKGTFSSLPSPHWTLTTDPYERSFYWINKKADGYLDKPQISESSGIHEFSKRLMLLPQPTATIELKLTYSVTDLEGTPVLSQVTRTTLLNNGNWLPNQRIKYIVDLPATGINEIIFTPSVEAWTAATSSITPP